MVTNKPNGANCRQLALFFLTLLIFYYSKEQGSSAALAPIAVKILLCRCSAQKIATNSGKKLVKIISNRKKYNKKLPQGPL